MLNLLEHHVTSRRKRSILLLYFDEETLLKKECMSLKYVENNLDNRCCYLSVLYVYNKHFNSVIRCIFMMQVGNEFHTLTYNFSCNCRPQAKGNSPLTEYIYINKIQRDATVFRCLFTAKLLYMFRVSIAPIIRSTSNCNCSFWYRS